MSTAKTKSFTLEGLHEAPFFKEITDAVTVAEGQKVEKDLKEPPKEDLVLGELTPYEVMLFVWASMLSDKVEKVEGKVPMELLLLIRIFGSGAKLSESDIEKLEPLIAAKKELHFVTMLLSQMLRKRFAKEVALDALNQEKKKLPTRSIGVFSGFVATLTENEPCPGCGQYHTIFL
jgi:hypothetical protein